MPILLDKKLVDRIHLIVVLGLGGAKNSQPGEVIRCIDDRAVGAGRYAYMEGADRRDFTQGPEAVQQQGVALGVLRVLQPEVNMVQK